MRHIEYFASLLALLPLASAAHAQENAARPATEQVKTDDTSREARRILHLASGQAIRVVARETESGWEYKTKDGAWKPIARGMVLRTERETDALGVFNRAKDAADLKQTEPRLELAGIAFERGLVQEGLDQLEFVLRSEPDRSEALALLRSRWLLSVPSLDVPAEQLARATDELLRFGASAPLAVREIAVNELAKLPADDALCTTLEAELRSKIVTRRSFGALALRRIFPGRSVKPLLMHAILDPSEDVRRNSSLALKAVNESGVIAPVVRALGSSNGSVRLRAAEALGTMGYAAAVEPLVARMAAVSAAAQAGGSRLPHANIFVGRQTAYIQDFDVEVAQFQAVADPQINVLIEGQTTDAAVQGETVVETVTESVVLRRALANLVGEKVGDTNKAWLAWWEANKARWNSRASTPGGG